ncbi:hypothetical protein ACJ73_04547 [Blastomyces percursus]|uniref:Uncharacterized protein n=1 Tax=Blastomyces percursus TaxID=1658174 RepID=A0A1J9R6G0_9EURO|nr:hypothetical protein ACJ73_04547 [Blastomyces percursus]
MGHYRARFARASRIMPERQFLATNIFEVATLRSKVGREVLRDMIALCSQKHEIETRLGLEPNKCHCGHLHNLEVDDSANQRPSRTDEAVHQDLWKDHVSSCFKQQVVKGQHGPDDVVGCTHPDTRCKQLSVSLLQLRFHFQDVHCTEVDTEVDHVRDSRGTKGVKRPFPRTDCKESEGNHTTKRSRRSLHARDLMAKPLPEEQYVFINEIERIKSGLQGQVMQLHKL